MMTAEDTKAKSRRRPARDEVEEEDIMQRLDRIEKTMEAFMLAITNDDYREHWEKKKNKRMKARVVGTPAQAQRARVGRAAKASGYTFPEWVEKYGMREKMLTPEERASRSDSRQMGIDLSPTPYQTKPKKKPKKG